MTAIIYFSFIFNILYLVNFLSFLYAFVLCVPKYEQLIAKSFSSVYVHNL